MIPPRYQIGFNVMEFADQIRADWSRHGLELDELIQQEIPAWQLEVNDRYLRSVTDVAQCPPVPISRIKRFAGAASGRSIMQVYTDEHNWTPFSPSELVLVERPVKPVLAVGPQALMSRQLDAARRAVDHTARRRAVEDLRSIGGGLGVVRG